MDSSEQENREERGIGTLPLEIIALSPLPGRTPWWARKLTYSHIAMAVGNFLWDQPMDSPAAGYFRDEWLAAAGRRQCMKITIRPGVNGAAFRRLCTGPRGTRKGQPWRTVLRYFHLWPWPAWNCTTPVRQALQILGLEVKGETPDEIVRELLQYSDSASDRG